MIKTIKKIVISNFCHPEPPKGERNIVIISRPIFHWIVLLFVISTTSACQKEELPIPAHNPGDVITNNVKMEADYRYQLFFDLETNAMVKKNLKTDWDLGFETSTTGNKIILNSAKYMQVANTQQTSFVDVNNTTGYTFNIDMPSGSLDSTAFGELILNNIYIVDRGYNELGAHQGFSKIELLAITNTDYKVHFSNLDGTNDVNITIPKNNDFNFTFLSLSGSVVTVEPPKEDWDIAFTQYTHFYHHDQTNYLVAGCLGNRSKVEIAPVFDKDFSTITIKDITNYAFSRNINTIGFEWKEYNFDTGKYLIFSDKNYIIKSTEGKYYKLHFIDFYDLAGVKGTPTFEFQEL